MLPYLIAGAIGYGIAKLFEDDNKPKYVDGGSVLLAPNGKPSNLTPEQYKLVREPAFIQWFGDWQNDPENSSKVVDENGEPLVVWRGVKGNNYDYKKSGYNYFAKNKSYGKIYGDILHPFFLNIRNPLDLEFFNKISAENGLTSFNNEGLFQIGDVQLKNEFDNETSLLYLDDLNDVANKFYYLFNNGDGIIGYDIGFYGEEIVFVTKEPNQVKLADGTNTTFDSNNPDIRFDGGGLLDDVFTLNTYIVQTGDDSYSHEEYIGNDYDEALSIYNGITPNDFVRPNSNYNYKNLTKNSVKYKFIGELEEGYEISDFTDNLDDNDYWEYIGDDYEDLLYDKVEAVNEVTDDYISEIKDFINNEYVQDRYSSKYMKIDVYADEEQEDYLDHITIRTTDHSQNPANKTGTYNLSFVIADANDTKQRWRSRDEYYYDSSDDIEDIKSEILTIIEEKIQEVKEDYN